MPQDTGHVRARSCRQVVKTSPFPNCGSGQVYYIVSASTLAWARDSVGIHGVHLMPLHIKSTRAVMRNVAHCAVTAPVWATNNTHGAQ
jgi:hypothetical protein